MEPIVSTLVLHPAVLIASGFESLTSKQVRFLNAYRHHFTSRFNKPQETIVLKKKDFQLGGIGNPHASFRDPQETYNLFSTHIPDFPYLTTSDILNAFYLNDLNTIWTGLLNELCCELDHFCLANKWPIEYLLADTKVIHQLYSYPVYQKITALHLCGLGQKVIDAFDFAFEYFKKQRLNH